MWRGASMCVPLCTRIDRIEIIDRPLTASLSLRDIPSARSSSFWASVMAAMMETLDGLSAYDFSPGIPGMLLSIGNVRSTTRLNFTCAGSCAEAADAMPTAKDSRTNVFRFIICSLLCLEDQSGLVGRTLVYDDYNPYTSMRNEGMTVDG